MFNDVVTGRESYVLTLRCGCTVYVSCHPRTGVAHTRIIERRGAQCPTRAHVTGARLWLWEILPEPETPAAHA